MQAEIITIGDEILIGQIVDTNSAFIAKSLNDIGVSIYQVTSVHDEREHILKALAEANKRSKIVLVTGGLGPTKDDITKQTLCGYFEDSLVRNEEVLKHIEMLFATYISTPISDLNRNQALVPSKATILHNQYGTAPGMWIEKNDSVFVFMPGVPFEMKALLKNQVLHRITERFERPHILHKTIMTYGLGESAIANRLEAWEEQLPEFIKLAYLPNLGRVRLRLTAKGPDHEVLENEVEKAVAAMYPLIGEIIYGVAENESIEYGIGKLLTEKGLSLSTAESFTGGKIANQITMVPGASNYFKGSVVAYATEAKIDQLGIDERLVAEHSVVSEEGAMAMAQNASRLFKTDFAIATTGNAGPTKGDSDAPVGTVFIGIASPQGVFAQGFTMGNHRERIVQKSVNKAFELLQKEILKF